MKCEQEGVLTCLHTSKKGCNWNEVSLGTLISQIHNSGWRMQTKIMKDVQVHGNVQVLLNVVEL